MKNYLVKNNSDTLIVFYAGWGCDEKEFSHLNSKCDVLILYEYNDLKLDFDFSKYKKFVLLAFSAGVFVSSAERFNLDFERAIAISGSPYLFDNKLGLTKEMIKIFNSIDEKNCDDFRKNYLVQTKEEFDNFIVPNRTFESCTNELSALENIYKNSKIKYDFDFALIGEHDPIFKASILKEIFKGKYKIVPNARHNFFYRFKSFDEIIAFCNY